MDDAWFLILHDLLQGKRQDSRNGGTYEEIGFSFRLHQPSMNFVHAPCRKLSPIYAAAELLWYLSGSNVGDMICHYAPQYKRFLDHSGYAYGGYGPRIMHQVGMTIDMLKKTPDTRQAVMSIWKPIDLQIAMSETCKDVPCTLSLQFLLREGRLNLVTTMRSNDAWLGLPYDVFCFTSLQSIIAAELNSKIGTYIHNVGSMHLYDKDVEKFEKYEPYRGQDWQVEGSKFDQMMIAVEMEKYIRTGVMKPEKIRLAMNDAFKGEMNLASMTIALCSLQGREIQEWHSKYIPQQLLDMVRK